MISLGRCSGKGRRGRKPDAEVTVVIYFMVGNMYVYPLPFCCCAELWAVCGECCWLGHSLEF
jgi:hypothetical protein